MSSTKSQTLAMQMAKQQAMAKVIEQVLPQFFSSNEVIQGQSEVIGLPVNRNKEGEVVGVGGIDEWKTTKIPPDLLMPLIYASHRAQFGKSRAWGEIRDLILRGSVGIDGFRSQQAENIVMGLAGSGRSKQVSKRGWVGRNITHRGEPEYEEEEE